MKLQLYILLKLIKTIKTLYEYPNMDDKFKYVCAIICMALCFSSLLLLLNKPESARRCNVKHHNPEKVPNLYFNLIHNTTSFSNDKIVFQLKVYSNLDIESKLVAASDTVDFISKRYVFYKYPFTTTITYGRAISRNVTFFNCFESSILFNEIIQMNILPMLKGGLVTLTFWKNQ